MCVVRHRDVRKLSHLFHFPHNIKPKGRPKTELEGSMEDKLVIPDDSTGDATIETLNECKQRELAFFDEVVQGYVVVKRDGTEVVKNPTATVIVRGVNGQSSEVSSVQLELQSSTDCVDLYRISCFVSFPKIKLDEPSLQLTFDCQVEQKAVVVDHSTHILPSGYPADRRNLLSSLKSVTDQYDNILLDSLVKDNKVDNNTLREQQDETVAGPQISGPRQVSLSLEIPIIRLLNLRVRNVRTCPNKVLSTIDIEPSSRAKGYKLCISIDSLKYHFQRAITEKFHVKFPLMLESNDSFSFTFQLDSYELIIYKTLIEVDYSCSQRKIKTKLVTSVDFLSQFTDHSQQSLKQNSLAQAIQIKFIGSKHAKLGHPFYLKVRVVNTSSKTRNLVLVFNSTDQNLPSIPKLPTPVYPSLSLLKNYTSSKVRTVGVISLCNEVHFKCDPGRVFDNEITLMGLQLGVYNMHGVKLVDVNTGETINCDKYLEIVVEDGES